MESAKKVFYVYDERMLKHQEYVKPAPEGSAVKPHVIPEIPDRIARIHEHLRSEGYLD